MPFRILRLGSYFGLILIIVLCWFNISFAQKETQTTELERLSQTFSRQLQEMRPQLYYDLLAGTDSVQVRLNSDPDIELMYINNRGMPVYYIVENLNAARTLSTDDVWPGGSGGFSLTGSGTGIGKLGIWDGGGVLATHQELSGRVTQIDSPGGTHYHSTHVAGTMIASGVQSTAKGMSYQANLTAYDWNNDNSEMSSAAASGMNISNHSYGLITGWYNSGNWYWYGDISVSTTEDYGFGFYSSDAQAWDQIAYNAPYYTIVKSAGNDRNDAGPGPGGGHYVWDGGWIWSTDTRDPDGGTDGYDCISYAGTAKNIITVGAVDDITGGYSVPADVVMSSFSGWGPVDDGRIKPDIVANGISLYSSMDNNNSAYDYLNGTSMSTPNLSGSLNLLVRHYEATHASTTPRSSTMKAVIIQTADEAGPNPGPDYMFGWGLMNTLRAAQLIELDSTSAGIIIEDSLSNLETKQYEFASDGIEPIRITLAWTDPAGTPPSPSLNPTTLVLVNDLDLRLEYIGTGTTYYPYILNPSIPANAAGTGDNIRDNIEQIYVDLPSAGTYRLSISHKGTLGVTQYYSLAGSVNLQIPTSGNPPVALCTNTIAVADSICQADASINNGSYDPDGDPITLVQVPTGPYPLGQTTVSLIVTDSSGLADTCQGIVTVNDNTPPVLACPADTSVDNDPGLCSAVVSFTANANDNCSGVTIVSTPPSGSAFPVGTTQVEVVAADSSGNADTCYFNITVNDTEPPVVICPIDTVVNNDSGRCDALVLYSVSAADNCSGAAVTSNPPSGSTFPVGITQVEVVATDSSGNADTCYFNITVNDIEPPVVICPADTAVGSDLGQCGALVSFTPIATDNCSGTTISAIPPSGSFFPVGITQVQVVASDSSGNADTCYFNISVNDIEPPVAGCPADTVIETDPGQCGAIVSYSVGATDNCSISSIISNPSSGSFFPLGTTPVEVIASDPSGNADTCYFNITVNDTEPPVIVCPADTVLYSDSGRCDAIVFYSITATDNCSGATVISNPPSGSSFPAGITQVEVIASDSLGNADTCYFNITVNDNEPPVVVCPGDTAVNSDPGECGAVVNFNASATDNCAGVTVVSNPPSGSLFPVGLTAVEVIATDASGNADTCYFNVTVADDEAPVAICPLDISMGNDPGLCGATVSFTPSATDNCPGVSVYANPASGSFFQLGSTQVEAIAIDAAGNSDTCYFDVTVIDAEPPQAICPADTTVEKDSGQCTATVSFSINSTDNCSGSTVIADPPSGSLFPVGITPVEVIASDSSGNSDTCYFNITVNDNEPPAVICPADTSVVNDPGQCGAIISFTADATDNCPGVNVISNPGSGSLFPIGITQIEVIAIDAVGNSDTCYFNITVIDNEPPIALCPADTVVGNSAGMCGAYVSYPLNASDNCPGGTVTSNPPPGSFFNIGTTPVTIIATDSTGNADSCYFNVTVIDTEPPVAVCPADTAAEADSGQCGTVVLFSINATDNCPGATVSSNPPSGSSFPVGVSPVEVIAIDSSGNADTCYFNVTVNDNEPPVVTCPADTVINNDPDECGAAVAFSASAVDNCGAVTITSNPSSGSLFPAGVTQVEVIASDSSGNSDTCYFNITVNDIEPPVAGCPADTVIETDPGQCGADFSFAVSALDNCSISNIISNPPSGSFFAIGMTPVEVIATDDSGNADTCYFNITVMDSEAPEIICPNDTALINETGLCGAHVDFSLNAADNCPGVTVSSNPPSGSFFSTGSTYVQAVATDSSGNADTCYFFISVYDNEPPVAGCIGDQVVGNDSGECGAVADYNLNTSDNCPGFRLITDPPEGSFLNLGLTPVQAIAIDGFGNADTCYFNMIVMDTEPPVPICPDNIIVENDSVQCGAVVTFAIDATDNCPGATVSANPPSGSFFPVGVNTVAVIAADSSGNADTCFFDITVNDTETPFAICPPDTTVGNDSGLCGATVSFTMAADDNCPGATVSSDPPSGSFFLNGVTPVTVVASDNAGNVDTCYFNITVIDTEPPLPICPDDIVVGSDSGQCGAAVTFAIDVADNCPGATVLADPPSGSFFAVETSQVIVAAIDSSGNADTCYFNVTVNDAEPPIIACPADTIVENEPDQCGATVVFSIAATDNCTDVNITTDPPSGSFFPVGVARVTAVANDSTGNVDTCYFNITVNDTEPPAVSCPADTALDNDPGLCGATVIFSATADDNCPGVMVAANPPSGSFFPVGITEVVMTAVDSSGNADTCYFSVIVNDTIAPVIECPANIFVDNDPGQCGANVSFSVNVTDNCPGAVISTIPPSGDFFPVGTTQVTAIAIDSSGHADTCLFEISVSDVEPPLAPCPPDTIVYVSLDQDSAFVVFILEAEDNCDSATVVSNPPSNSWFNVGTTIVEVIASDPAGFTDTCYFNVTVEQTPMPIPTLSEWGMIIFSLLLLTVGTIAIIRKRNILTASKPS